MTPGDGPRRSRPLDEAVFVAERVVTCDPARATAADPLGVVEHGAVRIERGRIVAVGAAAEVGGPSPIDAGELLTPGLVDAHTHAAYVGSRHDEYAMRMAGAGYEAIAAAGGGIVSSMRAVRAATLDQIRDVLLGRLARMASLGVTTVEVKSGYGLDLASELKQLRAIAAVGARSDVPRVVPTYLALHALPPEASGDRAGFAARVAEREIDAVVAEGLARFVDAYVDRSAFGVDHARPVLARGKALGLGVRIHVGQFADVGGAELAASLGAASADHLEHVSEAGADAMARAGVRAVLLPVASYTLGQAPPPVDVLRRAGVRIVVASDANPGTAPTESLPLAMAFAVRSYELGVAEVLLGATREAALSLGLDDVGRLSVGARADLVSWRVPHEAALIQPHGVALSRWVLRDGALVSGAI